MKKKLFLLFILIILASLVGCTQTIPISNDNLSSHHYPITVTDHSGREVTIEKEPQKLISCYYITTSLLIALDLDEKMVGIEDHPEYRPIYSLSAPHLLELPWVGTAKTLDLEGCAAVQPDLVILPLRLQDSAKTLEELGIDVLLVNPESQELLTDTINMIGIATDTEAKAKELLDYINTAETHLQESLQGVSAPSIYLSGNSNFLSTAGNSMYQADMIHLSGGTNVAKDLTDTYWAEIDYEQLLAWNPDYIILASNAKYTVSDVLNDPNLAACSAIQNRQVYQIPSDIEAWDSPVPGSFLGAFWLAHILHPENISDTTYHTLLDEYYETFYGFTYNEN